MNSGWFLKREAPTKYELVIRLECALLARADEVIE